MKVLPVKEGAADATLYGELGRPQSDALLSHAFKSSRRDFPVVQLFQTLHPQPGGPWPIPGQGTKAHLPQLKILNTAAKAWYSQENKKQRKWESVSIWLLGTCRRSDRSQNFPTASLSQMEVPGLRSVQQRLCRGWKCRLSTRCHL